MEQNQRQYTRFKAAVPIELRPNGVLTPLRGQTTDICLGGCYVETMFTQEVSTAVDIGLWIEDSKIDIKSEVVSKHPSFGNGYKFVQLDKDSAAKLIRYLESLSQQETKDDSSSDGSPTLIV
jgi:c-di-GMP-binding flagellar brake protein YcgR